MQNPAAASTIAPHSDRRAAPLDVLLPQTFRWLARLPHEVRPMELSRSFPRIANLLAANWDEPEAIQTYFVELLIDRRGNRKGFPPQVKRELLALQRHDWQAHPRMPARLSLIKK